MEDRSASAGPPRLFSLGCWAGQPLPDDYDLRIYAKNGHRPPLKAVDCIIESMVRYLRSGDGRWLESEPPEDIEFLAQVFPLLRRVDWIEQRKIHQLARMEPQAIRGRAFYGLRQLLIAISQRISVAIHVDDLQ